MADFTALEKQYGLPLGLLSAVQYQESRGDANAVSPAGAQGAFQFMPNTAKQYGIDPFDPDQAALGAAKMYADLAKKYDNDVPSMLAAYNWGQGNLDKHGLEKAPSETRNYIKNITARMGDIQQPSVPPVNQGTQYAAADTGIMSDAMPSDLPDLSKMTDEELDAYEASLNGTPSAPIPAVAPPALPVVADSAQMPDLSKMTDEELDAYEASLANGEPPTESGFMERMGEDWNRRKKTEAENRLRNQKGDQSMFSTNLITLGQGLGTVGDVGANAAGSLARYAWDIMPDYQKEIYKGAYGKLGEGAKELASTETGKSAIDLAKQGVQKGQELAKEYPTTAGLIGAAGNLAALAPMGAGAKAVTEGAGGVLSSAGKGLVQLGEEQALKKQVDFAKKLVMPRESIKEAEKQAGRTVEKGVNRKQVVEPSALEQSAIDEVTKLKEVKPSKSDLGNRNAIQKATSNEAESLLTTLKRSGKTYEPEQLGTKLDDTLTTLKSEDPFILGKKSEGRVADAVFAKMKALAAQNEATPAGLLKARQQFDKWAKSKSRKVFESGQSTFSNAVTEARQAVHNVISETVPDAKVAASLKKQHALIHTLGNLDAKIARAPKTRFGRAVVKATDFIPAKNPWIKYPLEAGLVGTGGAALLANPMLAPLALGTYGVGKALNSPMTKKILGKTLETTGNVLRGGKRLPEMKVPVIPPKQLALPHYPEERELVAGWDEAPRAMTQAEQQSAKLARERAKGLGLTPDVRKAQEINAINADLQRFGQSELGKTAMSANLRNRPLQKVSGNMIPEAEFSPAHVNQMMNKNLWNKLDKTQKAEVSKQVEQMWNEHKTSIQDMIASARKRAQELSEAKGEVYRPTVMGQALEDATKKKKGGLAKIPPMPTLYGRAK